MKEHIYTVDGNELRVRYYSDRLEIVINGQTISFNGGNLIKYIRNVCNVYLSEYPVDGEVIYQQEETLLTQANSNVPVTPVTPVVSTTPTIS